MAATTTKAHAGEQHRLSARLFPRPVPRPHRGDARVGFDARRAAPRTRAAMPPAPPAPRPIATPSRRGCRARRDDRPESHGAAGNWSAKISHSSVSRARPRACIARPDGIVGVGIPALGIVEDADGGVAVGRDVDEAADLLRPPRRVARAGGRFCGGARPRWIRIAALSLEDAAVVDDERRDLRRSG